MGPEFISVLNLFPYAHLTVNKNESSDSSGNTTTLGGSEYILEQEFYSKGCNSSSADPVGTDIGTGSPENTAGSHSSLYPIPLSCLHAHRSSPALRRGRSPSIQGVALIRTQGTYVPRHCFGQTNKAKGMNLKGQIPSAFGR